MSRDVFGGDLYVNGTLYATTWSIAAGQITNAMINGSAGISASKLQQQRNIVYAQASASAVVAETKVVHVAYGATATVAAVKCGLVSIPSGDKTAVVDVKKNGTTILSATVTLDSANVARTVEAATLSGTPTLVTGDVLEVVVTIAGSTGTDPKGVFVEVVLTEDAA